MDIVTYALSKKYTDESIQGISGALAGKNCTIESAVKQDGITTVVFLWTADDGTQSRTSIKVKDGTPIYLWESGEHYKEDDLCIYGSTLYMCVEENTDAEFDKSKWKGIGGGGGTEDYEELVNKPSINGKELEGDVSLEEIGDVAIPDEDIIDLVANAFGA